MKRLSILLFTTLLVLFLSPIHVQAASGLISGISIYDDNISKKLNFSLQSSEYTIYILSLGTVNVDIQAANDDIQLMANGQQSMEQLSISKAITTKQTVLSISA